MSLTILGVGVAGPTAATAYTHSWSCSRYASNHCTDYVGTPFNPWHNIQSYDTILANWCVKGTDGGGGIWGFACTTSTVGVSGFRCNAPNVQAYSYGTGYPGPQQQDSIADTNGNC